MYYLNSALPTQINSENVSSWWVIDHVVEITERRLRMPPKHPLGNHSSNWAFDMFLVDLVYLLWMGKHMTRSRSCGLKTKRNRVMETTCSLLGASRRKGRAGRGVLWSRPPGAPFVRPREQNLAPGSGQEVHSLRCQVLASGVFQEEGSASNPLWSKTG